jgi:hypothetical protein
MVVIGAPYVPAASVTIVQRLPCDVWEEPHPATIPSLERQTLRSSSRVGLINWYFSMAAIDRMLPGLGQSQELRQPSQKWSVEGCGTNIGKKCLLYRAGAGAGSETNRMWAGCRVDLASDSILVNGAARQFLCSPKQWFILLLPSQAGL